MLRQSGIAVLSALVLAVPLLIASDGQAGSALVPPTKTVGPSLTATIVIDVTQTQPTPTDLNYHNVDNFAVTATGTTFAGTTGLTSIMVQKASQITAAIFRSDYIRASAWTLACTKPDITDLQQSTAFRFTGFIDTMFPDETTLNSVFANFGLPHKAAIVNQSYVTCSVVNGRLYLSFVAVIQFQP